MDFFDVLDRLPDLVGLWLLPTLFLATLAVYYGLFRNSVRSVFDPLGMVLLFSSFATTFLVVLALIGFVDGWALGFVVATLALFYAPLLTLGRKGSGTSHRHNPAIAVPTSELLLVLFVVQLLIQCTTYAIVGIPILQDSRLTLYAEGGGIGLLGRLKDGLEIASVILPFIVLRVRRRGRAVPWLLIAAVAVGALLSGSKGAILVLPFGWYLAGVYVTGSWRLPAGPKKRRWVALVALSLVPIGVTLARSESGLMNVAQSARDVAIRLVAEGDGYAYFLGGNRIEQIAHHDVLALVRPITTALRVTDSSALVTPGFEIVGDLFGTTDSTWGPNTRLPIFILYFYGALGLVLAPVLGACLVFARNTTLRMAQNSPIKFAIACSVYAAFARTEVDPQIMVNGVLNVVLSAPLLLGAAVVFQASRRRVPGARGTALIPRPVH